MPASFKAATAAPISGDLVIGSASTSGRMIAVAATTSPGTLLHLVPQSGLLYQRIRILACNIDTVARTLTLQVGGTSTSDLVTWTLGPKRGYVCVLPDVKVYQGLEVRAYASAASVINCYVGTGERTKEP